MADATPTTALELRSLIKKTGELELSLAKVELPEPGPDQVLVKVEATPINPSDLGLLLGPADPATMTSSGSGPDIKVTGKVTAGALPFLAARLDQSMPVGNEGAGTVVKAGSSETAQALKAKLQENKIRLFAKTGAEGRLFGSIKPAAVATAVAEAGVGEIDKRKITVPTIKSTGEYSATIHLIEGVDAEVTLQVIAAR